MDPKEIFASDDRICSVIVYHDGFVPNSYRWPAPGRRTRYSRNGEKVEEKYDRKRSHGNGPRWVALSEKGGRLASR